MILILIGTIVSVIVALLLNANGMGLNSVAWDINSIISGAMVIIWALILILALIISNKTSRMEKFILMTIIPWPIILVITALVSGRVAVFLCTMQLIFLAGSLVYAMKRGRHLHWNP